MILLGIRGGRWAALAVLGALLANVCSTTVGFQQVTIPDRAGNSMQARIWYPSNVQTATRALGLSSQDVALMNGD
jgi:hypothetical protein